jgi:hypothetical protein
MNTSHHLSSVINLEDTHPTDLVPIFGDGILIVKLFFKQKFIEFLYFYSNELYRMKRMLERAELIKFIYLISNKLQYNNFKFIFENAYVSLHPFKSKKCHDKYDTEGAFENGPHIKYLNGHKDPKNMFKTKLLGKEFVKCDICGERVKIGTLSLYSYNNNIGGHAEHVIEYINNSK